MKKIIILILCLLLITGCTPKEKNVKEEKSTNLIEDKVTTKSNEDELVSEISSVENDVETLTSKVNITESDEKTLKDTWKTLTDFIFYNGTIKGYTFNELKTESQEKILETWNNIDGKIESKFPDYKENIKETSEKTYTNIKEKATSLKETIQEKYKNYVGEAAYNNTIENYEEGKENLKEVTEPYVEKGKSAVSTVKEKVTTWYNNWKEKSNE